MALRNLSLILCSDNSGLVKIDTWLHFFFFEPVSFLPKADITINTSTAPIRHVQGQFILCQREELRSHTYCDAIVTLCLTPDNYQEILVLGSSKSDV